MMGRAFAYGYGGYGCGGYLPMLLIFLLIIVLIVLVVKRPRGPRDYQRSEALEILNQRLAKGEITTEEYEKLKKFISA